MDPSARRYLCQPKAWLCPPRESGHPPGMRGSATARLDHLLAGSPQSPTSHPSFPAGPGLRGWRWTRFVLALQARMRKPGLKICPDAAPIPSCSFSSSQTVASRGILRDVFSLASTAQPPCRPVPTLGSLPFRTALLVIKPQANLPAVLLAEHIDRLAFGKGIQPACLREQFQNGHAPVQGISPLLCGISDQENLAALYGFDANRHLRLVNHRVEFCR